MISLYCIHRDLKPENIFLDDYLFPKIGDFGLSSRFISIDSMTHQSLSGIMLNPIYLSPEILESNEYSKASDVYAFAFIVYEILTNENPFESITNENKLFNEIVINGNRPTIKDEIIDGYRELIEKCWSQKPNERPTFDDILFYLKNNPNLITDKINKYEYIQYIKFLEESQVESNIPQKINETNEFHVKNIFKSVKSFDHIKIDETSDLNESDFVSNERDVNINNINDKNNLKVFENSIPDEQNGNLSEPSNFNNNESNDLISIVPNDDFEESSDFKNDKNVDSISVEQKETISGNNNSQLISEFVSSKNSKDLMTFINQECDNETISSVFNQCYINDKSLFLDLCKEGIILNNPVSHFKYALYLIYNSSNNELCNYKKAKKHLEDSMKLEFTPSYFLLARLSYEIFKDYNFAFNVAKKGAMLNDKYSKCLFGYFISRGIGTRYFNNA